jgi:CRP/FNR family transcriptional regulator, cyclic AMP receptor protein
MENQEITMNLFKNTSDYQAYKEGDVIFNKGEIGKTMYVVKEGEVGIYLDGQVVQVHGPGGIFGEMALIDQKPRSASAIARTSCQVVLIDERRFMFLIQQTPFFALQVMRIMAGRLRNLMKPEENVA